MFRLRNLREGTGLPADHLFHAAQDPETYQELVMEVN